MRIAVIGSGRMGGALGRLWAARGHEVTFSFSRDRHRLDALAKRAGPSARAGEPADAVRDADVVLMALQWHTLDDALAAAGSLAGKVVVSCSMPMTPDDSALAVGMTSSGAEELARRAPRANVISAFNTVPSELLAHLCDSGPLPEANRPSVAYAGDDEGAKAFVVPLIRDAGFDPVDAGPLMVARYLEPFALLIAQLAYETDDGPEVGYRFVRP
jgi:8-hydroxy-5-deazaflavin:NADPH oxidoreductase